MAEQKQRYLWLDRLRGVCVLSMIGYHTMWDLVHIFGVNAPWYTQTPGKLWQASIGWTFVLLSGFCAGLGRRSPKRGLTVFLCGAAVSAVTLLVMPENRILFGVLTLLGSCMLLAYLLSPALEKIPAPAGLAVNIILFLLFYHARRGYLGFGSRALVTLPDALYRNALTAFFGFPTKAFHSADYYPLLPWMFLFFTGWFLFRWLVNAGVWQRVPKAVPGRDPFAWIGRYSLWIYLAHQPVIYGVLLSIFRNQ